MSEGTCDDTMDEVTDYFTGLPILVVENVFKFLTVKELLTLRRVCRTTKAWVSSYPNRRCWDRYQMEIRSDLDGWQSFDDAVKSGLNATSIYINPWDCTQKMYDSPSMNPFVSTYGHHIRKLTVQYFNTFISDNEFIFFNSLTKLTELKLQVVDVRERTVNNCSYPLRFPKVFKNLKVLKFSIILQTDNPLSKTNYHWDLVRACPSLEFLRFPVAPQDYELLGRDNDNTYFQPFMSYIKDQIASPAGLTLRTLDLKNFSNGPGEDDMVMDLGYSFYSFLHHELKDVIKLRNAYSEMIFPKLANIQDIMAFNGLILSLNNLHPAIQKLDLPHMTKLVLNPTTAHLVVHLAPYMLIPEWPNLKTISVTIAHDSAKDYAGIDFVLKAKCRPTVQKLVICYAEHLIGKDERYVHLISSVNLTRNFCNLKILEITRWNTKNISFLKLWEGLSQLEELIIEDCKTFGNVALIGTDTENPSFLKLKKLRKVRLTLDFMPLITDRAFRDVFAKMRLKEFYLRSETPLQKVTSAGILNLLEGEFGKSIEVFPFRGWSLGSLSDLEFEQLGKKFRSIL